MLSLLLVFALFTPAYAADTASITLTLPESVQSMARSVSSGYTFDAYQIFTGTVDDSNPSSPVISNVQWGSGLTEKGKQTLLTDLGLSSTATAEDAAEKLSSLDSTQAEKISTELMHDLGTSAGSSSTPNAQGSYVISGLNPGYYLINNTDVPDDVVGTKAILRVLGNATVETKVTSAMIPTLKKQVQDPETKDFQNITSYQAGSTMTYKLDATIAKNYQAFSTYPLTITDILPQDVSYVDGSISVSTGLGTIPASDYTVSTKTAADGQQTVTIQFADMKKVAQVSDQDLELTVTYQAKIEKGASDKLINTASMSYRDDVSTDHTGSTPTVSTTVVNFGLNISKVDQKGDALEGAGFALYRVEDGKDELVEELASASTAPNIFNFKGLAPGTYKLVETITPEGFNTIAPITFTVAASYNQDTQCVKSLSGTGKTIELTPDSSNSALSASITNTSGVTLPRTGSTTSLMMLLVGAGIMALAGYGIYHFRKEA